MTINNFLLQNTEEHEDVKWLSLILMGHSAFQLLNAGCRLGVFETLNEIPGQSKFEINKKLNLQERPLECLLLGLTSLNLIRIENERYYNNKIVDSIFKNDFWKTFYDIVMFENKIVYQGEFDFIESLKQNSNVGLQRIEGKGADLYYRLSESEESKSAFFNYMSSWSAMSIPLLINSGVFSNSKQLLDIGGGDGTNAIEIAKQNPNIKLTVLELTENSPLLKQNIKTNNLESRIKIIEGNMFDDDFPGIYDCILFLHILVIWSKEQILFLLKKSYNALEPGGKLIIFNSISSDDENGPLFAALDSVYFMSIPANGGMIYPWKFYESCLTQSGFTSIQKIDFKVWSPHGAIIATK